MKKVILSIGVLLFIIILFPQSVFASSSIIDVNCDGNYIEGEVYTTSENIWQWTEYQIYKYSLQEPGKVNIHFISHTNNALAVQVKDSDEYILADQIVQKSNSPVDFPLYQREGEYYIYVLIEHSSTSGDYKFKIDFTPKTTSSDIIMIGETYKGLFASTTQSNEESQQVELSLEKEGEYIISLKSDMDLECNIKTQDEDIIQTFYSFEDGPFMDTIELPAGRKIVEFNSYGTPGTYEFKITTESQQEKEKAEDEDTNSQDNAVTKWKDRFLSPSKFSGALIVTVLGGVIVAIITRVFFSNRY